MAMSKKDYQAIAGAIYCAVQDCQGMTQAQIVNDIAGAIADVMEQDSPRFDRARFLEACETGKCKGMRAVSAS